MKPPHSTAPATVRVPATAAAETAVSATQVAFRAAVAAVESLREQLRATLEPLVNQVRPDFIFYQAGVDVLATDKLGKLALTPTGCRQRDELVLDLCYARGLPVAVSMGGGYSERLADIVDAHCNTFRVAFARWP